MVSMASTPLALVLFTILINLNLNGYVTAQPEFLYNFCINETGFYRKDSLYETNLYNLLFSLSSNVDLYGFYNAASGQGSDTVHALALCRGDFQHDVCQSCINYSVRRLTQLCPNHREAIGWYDNCMIRYSNKTMFGVRSDMPAFLMWNTQNATNPLQFNRVVMTLLDRLRGEAIYGGPRRKFAFGNVTNVKEEFNKTIYAVVQCTPDLSVQNCSGCLIGAMNSFESGKVGGRYIKPSCNYRFEQYLFYNTTLPSLSLSRLQPPPLPPPPPPPPPAPPPPPEGNQEMGENKSTIIIISVVASTVGSLVILIFIFVFLRKRKQKQNKSTQTFEALDEISSTESLQYDFDTIRVSTNDFSETNMLGQGGFGAVYKGKLPNGTEIAVKRLSKGSRQGELEFKNEVILVAKLQHRNLVRLLGFSLANSERLLIYEYVSNSSLDKFIFDQVKRTHLDWEMLSRIIGGVARGVLYLHEDSRLRIIHRDLKASNVLLDENMNPKISDFGMARLFVIDEVQGTTNRIVGTYGYMAPEYAMYGQFSVKSDVFSFGVLVLEIITGLKNSCFRNEDNVEDLLTYAWKNWKAGTALNVIDTNFRSNLQPNSEIMRCLQIGLLCVQENMVIRPTIGLVIHMLNNLSLSLPSPLQPAFFIHNNINQEMAPLFHGDENDSRVTSYSDKSQGNYTKIFGNNTSITDLYPR